MAADPELRIVQEGVKAALSRLDRVAKGSESVMKRTNFRIGAQVRDVARQDFSPVSPTQQLINANRKGPARQRKPRAYSRTKPGGLERSHEFLSDAEEIEVFIATNSEAGPYAFRMHEMRGKEWWNRGPGTISKGPKAGDRFIERAIVDQEGNILSMIQSAQDDIVGGM